MAQEEIASFQLQRRLSLTSSKGSTIPRFLNKSSLRKKDTLKNRLLEAKLREETQKRKTKERLYRRKLITKQRRLQEELEYLTFPTLGGFYFDGFQNRHFLLKKEWADIFNASEEVKTRKEELDHHETFQEMVKRNFWPPRIFGGIAFRTRGIYLDCKEVQHDPPRTPPEVSLLHEHDDDEFFENEQQYGVGVGYGPGGEGDWIRGSSMDHPRLRYGVGLRKREEEMEITKHDFYFDEDIGNFFPRASKSPESFYFDRKYGVWRLKRATMKYNGDWFFDANNGCFMLKDRSKAGAYYFDRVWNVWKMRGNDGPSATGLLPKDYFYNELHAAWILKDTDTTKSSRFDENGWRFAKRIPITGPDDFYFDESKSGQFLLKGAGQGKLYVYDEHFGAWRRAGAENRHCKLKPSDYYWSDGECAFKIKDGPRMLFDLDTNNRFFRKKKVLEGKHKPSNWKWNIKTKCWELKKSNRSHFFAQVLHWRPDRDYEKPWLDIFDDWTGNYISFSTTLGSGPAGTVGASTVEDLKAGPSSMVAGQKSVFPLVFEKEKVYGERKLDLALKAAAKIEWGDENYKNSPQRIPFDSPAKDLIDFTSDKRAAIEEKKKAETAAEEVQFIDKSIDRKRLRCGNLGGMISGKELKAFFYAATAVTKPKEPRPNETDDYLYIQFKSDEAATAAFKTMDKVNIKGQRIALSYPRRHQK